MTRYRLIGAAKQIIAPLEHWGGPEDVFVASHYPIDSGNLNHVFIQNVTVDDYHPNWGAEIDCSFTVRYAVLDRIAEEAAELAWRAQDPDYGMPSLIEGIVDDTGYIEEIIVRSSDTRVILDQEKNTRYLAIDFECDALVRGRATD